MKKTKLRKSLLAMMPDFCVQAFCRGGIGLCAQSTTYFCSLSCPQEVIEMYSWCDALFSRAHYRYSAKVFSNQLGFASARPKCQRQPVTFVSHAKRFPTDRTEFMVPCIGRHEPIRTSPQTDDYYDRFWLAATPDRRIFYVFEAEKLGPSYVYKLYEEILDMQQPILLISEVERQKHVARERLLLTIPTINSRPRELERIYVNEVIIPNKPIQDELQGIQPDALYMLCAFLLTTASYGTELFIVDWEQIQKWDAQPGSINLYFDFEDRKHNGFEQVSYPCYGKHSGGRTTENQKVINMYRISSGPRAKSMVVYIHLSNRRDYKIRRLHENVSLTGLLAGPSPQTDEAGPSEPPSKRIRLEPTAPQDISYQLPSPRVAPLPTPAQQQTLPAWQQQYRIQPTVEPAPTRTSRPADPSSSAGQRPYTLQYRPEYQTARRDQQSPAAGPSRQIPAQQLGMRAAGSSQIPSASWPLAPPQVRQVAGQQLGIQAGGSSQIPSASWPLAPPQVRQVPGQQLGIHAGGSSQIPSASWPLASPQVGSSTPVLSPDRQFAISPDEQDDQFTRQQLTPPVLSQGQQLEIQVAGPSRQIPSTSQQLAPSQVGSSSPVLSPDRQFALYAGEQADLFTSTTQLMPPGLSQGQQSAIQAGGPSTVSPDRQFQALGEAYFSDYQSPDALDLQPLTGDYGLDYFTQIPDLQPSTDGSGLLDAWKQFRKDDPGPSGDS